MIKERIQNLLEKAGLVKEIRVEKNEEVGKMIPRPIMGLDPPDKKTEDYLNSANGWVYSCVSVISDEVAKVQLRLYKRTKNNELEEIEQHPLLDLLYKVNSYTTLYDHLWLSQQYLEMVGEAPWYLNRLNPSAEPNAMILLRPDKINVLYGSGDDLIRGYEYTVDEARQRKIIIEPNDLIFLRYPAPLRQFRGKGTAEAIPKTIDIDDFSEEWNRKFFYNSARPDAVLKTEQTLNDEQIKRLKAQWSEKYQGISNSSKLAVLEAGLDYSPIAPTQADMQFIEQQKFTRDKILGIFRVPKAIVAQTEGVNFASSKVAQYNFARFTVDPKVKRIVEQLNEFLVPQFGEDLILSYDSIIPEDDEVKLKTYDNGLKNGWLTINEVRQKEGYDEIEGGDDARLPLNMTSIGQTMPPEKPADEKMLKLKARTRIKDEIRDEFKSVIKEQVFKDLKEKQEKKKQEKKDREIERKEVFWKETVRYTEEEEKKVSLAVRLVFRKQQAKVLTSMTKSQKLGFDLDRETEILAKELKPVLFDIIKRHGEYTIEYWNLKDLFSGIPFEAYFGTQLRNIKGINKTNQTKLKDILKRAEVEGTDLRNIKNQIRREYKKFDERAEAIARTETIKYSNWAKEEAFKQSGYVIGKEWVDFAGACPFCKEVASKFNRKRLGDNFYNKGDTVNAINDKGKKVSLKLDYEDIITPPLHTNCRCTLVPIYANDTGTLPEAPSFPSPKKVKPQVEKKKEVKEIKKEKPREDDEFLNMRKQINNILDNDK